MYAHDTFLCGDICLTSMVCALHIYVLHGRDQHENSKGTDGLRSMGLSRVRFYGLHNACAHTYRTPPRAQPNDERCLKNTCAFMKGVPPQQSDTYCGEQSSSANARRRTSENGTCAQLTCEGLGMGFQSPCVSGIHPEVGPR